MTKKPFLFFIKKMVCLLTLTGTFFLIWMSCQYYLELSQRTGAYRTVILKEPLSEKDQERVEKEENSQTVPTPFVLWKELSEETVARENGGKEITTSLIRTAGDLSLLFHGNTLLEEKDTNGCLISRSLAKELFGSIQVLGLRIFYQEQLFTIQGVLPEDISFFVLTGSPAKDTAFTCLSLPVEDTVSEFLIRHSLAGQELELCLLQDLAQLFLIVLPLGILTLFTFFLFQKGLSSRFPEILLWWGMAVVLLTGGFSFFRRYFYLPEGMIPDHWSNFAFWSDWWENIREKFLFLIKAPKSISQTDCILSFFQCTGSCVVSWFLAFISVSLSSIFSSTH